MGNAPYHIDRNGPHHHHYLQLLQQLIMAGPHFNNNQGCPPPYRDLIRNMMNNDINVRPTVAQVLQDPLLQQVGNSNCFYYDVMLDGSIQNAHA